jgi:hypothetical protein
VKRLSRGFRNLLQRASLRAVSIVIGSFCIVEPGSLAAQSIPRWEIGPIFSYTSFRIGSPSDEERAAGVGGRAVFNAHENVAAELEISGYPEVGAINGSGVHAAAHVKVTLRREALGFNLFAMAGPGFLREELFCCSGNPVHRHWTSLIWDVGGGIEMIPARRFSIRLDFKDVIQTREFTSVPSTQEHGLDFTIGVMFRFPSR